MFLLSLAQTVTSIASLPTEPPRIVYDLYEKLAEFEKGQLLVKVNTSEVAVLLNKMLYVNNSSLLRTLSDNVTMLIDNLKGKYSNLYLIEVSKIALLLIITSLIVLLVSKRRKTIAVKIWWFLHKNDIVVKLRGGRKRDEIFYEILALVIVIIVVVVIIGVSQLFYSSSTSFTELILLGKNNTLSDYPDIVPVGDNVTFTVAVYNHLGYTGFYKILVKIDRGGKTSNTSAQSALHVLREHYVIVPDNSSSIIRFHIVFNESGKYRLIFELLRYDLTSREFVYDGIWVHKWVDIVKP